MSYSPTYDVSIPDDLCFNGGAHTIKDVRIQKLNTMIERIKHFARHAWRRLSLSGAVGVVVIFIVFSLVIGSVQAIQENFQRQIEVDSLAQEVALLEIQNETVRLQNQYYQTDEYLELQARDLLGKTRPGEKVVILPKTTAKAPESLQNGLPERAEIPLEERSNFEQWLYFLFSDKRTNEKV